MNSLKRVLVWVDDKVYDLTNKLTGTVIRTFIMDIEDRPILERLLFNLKSEHPEKKSKR